MDCTEAQFCMYMFFLLTAVFGDSMWALRLPIIDIELRMIAFVLCVSGSFLAVVNHLIVISSGGVGKHGSSVAVRSFLKRFV